MKRKIRIAIGSLLILLALLAFSFPIFQSYLIMQHSNKSVAKFTNISTERIQENSKKAVEFDFESIQPISISSTLSELVGAPINEDQIIGQIVIPSININLTLFNGLNNSNLMAGAATMKANQVMGEANYSVASHFTPHKDTLFTNLPTIQIGAIVKITDKNKIYTYKVYDARIVESTDVHLIEDQLSVERGKPIISLMSCISFEDPDKRFFAFGELLETTPYSAIEMSKKG